MRSYVEVTVKVVGANGKDGSVSIQRPIVMGSAIPQVIKYTAEKAADGAWEAVR